MPLTNRRAYRYISLNIMLLCLLWSPVWAVDHLQLGDSRNNDYLPYGLDTVRWNVLPVDRPQIKNPMQFYSLGKGGDSVNGLYITASNPAPGAELTSDISVWVCRHRDYFLEAALRFTTYDFGTYHSTRSAYPGILVGGYRDDSSFVARILKGDSGTFYIPINHGVDADSDSVWKGRPLFVRAFDYDHDGREDAFFWTDPVRDKVPRDLVCLDPDAGTIKWKVPIASGVWPGQVFSTPDTLNPSVIFTAYGMGQGASDSIFVSDYGYVGIVDHSGRIVNHKFAAKFSDFIGIVQLPGDSLYLLSHSLPLTDSRIEADSLQSEHYLSIMDSRLNIKKSIQLPMRHCQPWLSSYDDDGKLDIYTLTFDGTIRIFDQDLTLLAASDSSSLIELVAAFPTYGSYDDVFVFQTLRGCEVYSHDLQKIAFLGTHEYYTPFELTDQGRMRSFIGSGSREELIAVPVRRSWIDLVSVFYYDYQIWVLSALFSLTVGLVVMNLYRSRVSRQRKALAIANAELAATHDALKRAQATIIAQEKYKQAKDMAGAFAHEIRNALFPADSALTKLVQLSDQPTSDPDRIRSLRESIRNSVSRAVSITEEISTYTKLDTLYAPETVSVTALVADLIKGHGVMLEENSIVFSSDGPADAAIRANRAHLGVVLSNLFLNAIHALQGRSGGAIGITWKPLGGEIEICFSDTGCGIAPEHIGRIFDAFFSTKATKGTGLGLATCKRIVEMYGGSIAVQSKLNEGTQFTIQIPAGISVADSGASSPSTHRSRHDIQ
ncbi:MAG: HAMP domain-containing sensor histidine kinase [Candidatus Zixiibacteriota bacterium]